MWKRFNCYKCFIVRGIIQYIPWFNCGLSFAVCLMGWKIQAWWMLWISIVCLKAFLLISLTLSQCRLAGPVYPGMPLECHWLIQCTLGYHWATLRILAGYTGTPLEKLSWNSPTLEYHWINLAESAPHRDATGETLTFAAYTGTPLEGLCQPIHAPTHIVKHSEYHPCQFEMTRWRETSKQVDRSLYIQP